MKTSLLLEYWKGCVEGPINTEIDYEIGDRERRAKVLRGRKVRAEKKLSESK